MHGRQLESDQMNNLTIIIPSRTATNLVPCVESVFKHENNPLARIAVIDDGLDLSALPKPLQVLCQHGAKGIKPFVYARNCNLGIRGSGTDDVILLNDDALLQTPGGFTAMQRVAEENPEFGIIGAVTNVTGQPLQQPRYVGLREVEHFAFVCVLIPRRTIDLIGLLDERYCIDYGVEDRDYCEAVRRMGMKCGVYDHCFVDHSQLVSTFRGDPNASRSYAANWGLFCEKWGIAS
jgi:GT2 family glycosyltransferase